MEKVLWVIDFKHVKVNPAIQKNGHLSQNLQDLCKSIEHQAKDCQKQSLIIKQELENLQDVVDKFRTMIEKFYDNPPPEEEEDEFR